MNNKPSDLIRKLFINNYNQKLQGNVAIDLGFCDDAINALVEF